MATFSKEIKSNRLLQSKRYTRATADSQEAFTQVIDLGVGEIYSQTNLIPTASIPYSSSAQNGLIVKGTDGTTDIAIYYYRLKLTPDDQGNQTYFALSSPATNTDPQTVQTNQLTNWLSNKYVSPSFAATSNAETQLPAPVGYTVVLSTSTGTGNTISPNDYQFDYKSGVVQFVGTAPGGNIYLTGYRYIGRTLQDDSTLGISGSFSGSFQGTITSTDIELTGSFNHTGSYSHIGDTTHTGNTDRTGTLIQDGNLTLTGSLNHTGSYSQIGNATLTGNTNRTGILIQDGNLTVTGSLLHTGSLNQIGGTTLTGNTGRVGTLTQDGNLILTGSLLHTGSYNQIGDTTLTGNTDRTGTLTQNGNLTLTGSFNHSGSQSHLGDTIHTGSIYLTGSIDVVGPVISNGINVVDNAIAMAIALG